MSGSLSIQSFANQGLEAIWNSVPLVELHDQEKTFRAGGNTTWTVFSQLGQISICLSVIEELAKAHLPICPPSTRLKTCCYAIPFFSGLLWAHSEILPVGAKQFVHMVHTYTGNLCQLIHIVCSFAYFKIDQPIKGVTGIFIHSVEILKSYHCISNTFQKNYELVLFISVNAARILLGSWHHVAYALFLIAINQTLSTLHADERDQIRQKIANRDLMAIGMQECVGKELVINPEHVVMYEVENPECIGTTLHDLQQFFEKIPYGNDPYFTMSLNKLQEDDDWQKALQSNPELNPVIYIQTGMKQFIYNIENRCIPTGPPISYSRLLSDAVTIAHLLKTQPLEEQASCLLDLAICSYYCTTGYVREVSAWRRTLLGQSPDLSLQEKVLFILADLRERCFQQSFVFILSQLPWLKNLYEKTGYFRFDAVHTYGLFSNLCTHLGLPSLEIATQDSLATVGEIDKLLAPYVLKPYISRFWHYYSEEEIINTIKFAIDGDYDERRYKRINQQVRPLLISQWLQDLLKAEKISSVEDAYDEKGCLKTPYVELLLLNSGALKIDELLPDSQDSASNDQEQEHKTRGDKKQLYWFLLIQYLSKVSSRNKS